MIRWLLWLLAGLVLGGIVHLALVLYLPPGYHAERARRYPVVYMHDGQNLFDATTAAFGVAWNAGATADRLIAAGRLVAG